MDVHEVERFSNFFSPEKQIEVAAAALLIDKKSVYLYFLTETDKTKQNKKIKILKFFLHLKNIFVRKNRK